jgi:hypothetical protein
MNSTGRIDHLRVASPCPANWEQMSGDDRVRFCDLCNLHVYNISQMTRREAETLVTKTEGRLCARFFRRADGTVITKDCPVGLRAIRRRVAKVAGAALAALMSLAATVAGQKPTEKDKSSCRRQVTITKSSPESNQEAGSIFGTVLDQNGAVVAGVKIKVARKNSTTLATTTTNEKGEFQFRGLDSDTYELRLEASQFTALIITEIKIDDKDIVTVAAILTPKMATVTMGIIAESEPLQTDMTIFSGDLIRRLPH